MGLRFSLQSANTVANLTFGKVMSCYRDIFESEETYREFIYFLDKFEENLYSGRKNYYRKHIKHIKDTLEKHVEHIGLFARKMHSANNKASVYKDSCSDIEEPHSSNREHDIMSYDEDVLGALYYLSKMFQRCKIKALLLYNNNNSYNSFMHSRNILKHLVHIHPTDSCLILQPEDCGASPMVFNAFPHFDVAFRQIDMWPAVLFWDNDGNFAFVPVSDEIELERLFLCARYEDNPMDELRRYASEKQKPQKYLIHLSDLHIGNSEAVYGKARIKSLVRKQLEEINKNGSAKVIITGDAVDSPLRAYKNGYMEFSDDIQLSCGEKPIFVPGNHDINNHGIAILKRNKRLANVVTEFPKILKLEDEKIILLLFNSNTNGSFAQGEIGIEQMAQMGNELDMVENLSHYNLIAVLHHHVMPIPRPDTFAKRLFGDIIEKTLILKDADDFLKWLKKRKVKVVLHGHKHIPFHGKKDGIDIIACGSSTGKVSMKEKGETCISLNIIKLNREGITLTQLVENIKGAGYCENNFQSEVIRF